MELTSWCLQIIFGAFIVAGIEVGPASDLYDIDVRQIAAAWESEHTSPANPYSLNHAELKKNLEELASAFPDLIRMEVAGKSVEGREIFLLTLGQGKDSILMWSQMHGDEPTATCSLIDLLRYIGNHRREPWIASILEKYTLLIVPMLNPDGAERMQRRNAQGIDINRDARLLQTPEGQLLKELRDRYRPFLGFNLHNQNATTTVGDTGKVATIALLAVAADVPGAPSSGVLAKQVTAVLYEALSPFVYGHVSRYDEGFNPRAFGDNLSLWGTPIVLIESGGNPSGEPLNFGVKLNFVGLLAVLNSLSTGRIQNANPAVFDELRLNSDNPIYETILQNCWLFTGTGVPLFRGDVAVRADMRAGARGQAIIAELGDLGVFTAHQTIDCSRYLVTPGLIAWDPEVSFLADGRNDRAMLERGIVTLLESARWQEVADKNPSPGEWVGKPRQVNWGFLVVGDLPGDTERSRLRLADWLSAGGRAWITDSVGGAAAIPRWFGVSPLASEEALKFRAPAAWQGDIVQVLTRYTSEAAARFGLGRRGVIAQGAPADLVLWNIPDQGSLSDLRECKPRFVLINGQLIDLSQPEEPAYGRFLAR
jgi:hypothetical protein